MERLLPVSVRHRMISPEDTFLTTYWLSAANLDPFWLKCPGTSKCQYALFVLPEELCCDIISVVICLSVVLEFVIGFRFRFLKG